MQFEYVERYSPLRRQYIKSIAATLICGGIPLPIQVAFGQTYPARPIRMIVPYPPGGGTDLIARLLGQKVLAATGQPLVVENKPGGSEVLGTDLVAHSPADGYMLLLVSNTFSINAAVRPKLPYSLTDLKPVAKLVDVPFALIINPTLPVSNVADLLAFAKAHPGELSCAHIGFATPHYMTVQWFNVVTGANITPIGYPGSGPALQAVLSNQVQMMFAGLGGATQFIKSGKLRALAVTSAKRVASEPDLPTLAEAGVPGIDMTAWFGLMAPAGVPNDVVQRIDRLAQQAMVDPDIAKRVSSAGMDSAYAEARQFSSIVQHEIENWTRIVKAADIKTDQL